MINLAIVKNPNSFLPEVKAYVEYFLSNTEFGIHPTVFDSIDDVVNTDVAIVFLGFIPFWKRYDFPIIGEYNSLSVGRFGRIKDCIKSMVNTDSNLIFLNEYVRRHLFVSKKKAGVYRGMGFFPQYILASNPVKAYDIVYSGTINRDGLLDEIISLANLGFKVAVIGTEQYIAENVYSLGILDIQSVYKIYSMATYGLNYTPDIHPYNMQDSTKVIEYCASGLKVITNKYNWINKFELEHGARFLELSSVHSKGEIERFDYNTPDVSSLAWPFVIDNSGLTKLILSVANK